MSRAPTAVPHHGRCRVCGKLRYATRVDARKAAQVAYGRKLRAYRCGDWWHYGHLPASTLRGAGPPDDRTRRARFAAGCPTPGRVGYHTADAATRAAAARGDARPPRACRCGRWHLDAPAARVERCAS